MARPEYKATVKAERLQREIRVDENLSISLWFNVQDPELNAQLDNYYNTNKDDWKKQPSIELQVKIGDTYHRSVALRCLSMMALGQPLSAQHLLHLHPLRQRRLRR